MLSGLSSKVTGVVSTFADRLSLAFAAKSCSRKELAAVLRSSDGSLGISVQAVGQQLAGKTQQMSAENAARAARFLGCDYYWLCTGEGKMALTGHSGADLDEALVIVGAALAAVPKDQRAAAESALAGWGREGGADHWRSMLSTLLTRPPLGKRAVA